MQPRTERGAGMPGAPAQGPRPRWSVRTLLLSLVVACLLPGVIGAALLFLDQYQGGRKQLEENTLQTVRALVQAVDSQLIKSQVAAQALSTSGYLIAGDLAAFHRQARQLLQQAKAGTNVVLSDASGQQLVNTLREYGEPLPRHGNMDQLRRVFASGQPMLSDIYIGGVARRPVMSIDVPVVSDGKVLYDLSVGIFPEQLVDILRSQRLPPDWVAGIFDRTGTVAARTDAPEQYVGQKGSPELVARMIETPEGTLDSVTREGSAVVAVYSRSPLSGWSVAIGIPRQGLEAGWLRTVSLLGLGIAAVLGISIVLAWYMGSRIARSVRALTAPAHALGEGGAVAVPVVAVREVDEVARALENAARLLADRTQALQQRESELAKAQRIAHLGSWTWDARTDAVTASEELCRIFGRQAIPPLAGQSDTLYPREAWQRLHAAVMEAVATGGGYELELPALRGDGTPLWVSMRGEAVRDAGGTVVGLRGTVQDITERRRAADELRELNASLEQRVQWRTRELIAANRELDAFAYTVSHDLRAPLRAMSGFSQALIEDYGDRLDDQAKDYLHEIDVASRRMRELIEGILALSRNTRGELQRDAVDLSALATRLLRELAAGDPARTVAWDVEPGLSATGDPRMLEVVLRNLLGNAWKYTGKTTAAAIRVFRGEIDGRRAFCVADNGAGFSMAHAERLFQPFQRLHRQDEFSGIGIGLATVQRIVRRHGGEIRAEGSPGGGATFRFTLADDEPGAAS